MLKISANLRILMEPSEEWEKLLDSSETRLKNAVLQSVPRILIYEARWLIFSQFWPLLKQEWFFEAAGAVVKIDSSQKLNHFKQGSLDRGSVGWRMSTRFSCF